MVNEVNLEMGKKWCNKARRGDLNEIILSKAWSYFYYWSCYVW